MLKKISSLIALVLFTLHANAGLITFDEEAAFQAAVNGSLTMEQFDDLVFEPGLNIASGGGYSTIWNNRNCTGPDYCLGLIETASVTFSFVPNVTAFGFYYNELNAPLLSYLDSAGNSFSDALTMSENVNSQWQSKFFGVISDTSLEWITIGSGTDSGGSVYFVDDVQFSSAAVDVPEPSMISLFCLAILALGFVRRAV